MKTLGTILPTERSLQINDDFAARQAHNDSLFASTLPALHGSERRNVGGETRYYTSARTYATVRNARLRWFETRADGHDYSISQPVA